MIKKTLMPFQVLGAKHLASGFHKMLADEMGLGKTISAIAASLMIGAKTALVVCPASVRMGWAQELHECLGHREGWDIISYNGASIAKVRATLRDKYDVFIADEAHMLKTMESNRTGAVFSDSHGLARRAAYKWVLTGTPILNRPRELHVILKCLAAKKIHPYVNFDVFAQRYCAAYFDGRAINTRGASNLDDLSARVFGGTNPFALRRTKAEVFPELPQRIITRLPIEVSPADWKAVEDAEREILDREAYISSIHEEYSQLGDTAKLHRIVGLAKVKAVSAFTDDLLDTVDKVVVFTKHRDVLENIVGDLGGRGRGCVVFQGGMSDDAKKASVDRFVSDPSCTVFVGNIQAAGTGLNGLQRAANDVVMAEMDWTPLMMDQAIGRVDRMGKKYESAVNAYFPFIPGSLESAILKSGDGKTKVIDRIMGGRWNAPSLDLGDLI